MKIIMHQPEIKLFFLKIMNKSTDLNSLSHFADDLADHVPVDLNALDAVLQHRPRLLNSFGILGGDLQFLSSFHNSAKSTNPNDGRGDVLDHNHVLDALDVAGRLKGIT